MVSLNEIAFELKHTTLWFHMQYRYSIETLKSEYQSLKKLLPWNPLGTYKNPYLTSELCYVGEYLDT